MALFHYIYVCLFHLFSLSIRRQAPYILLLSLRSQTHLFPFQLFGRLFLSNNRLLPQMRIFRLIFLLLQKWITTTPGSNPFCILSYDTLTLLPLAVSFITSFHVSRIVLKCARTSSSISVSFFMFAFTKRCLKYVYTLSKSSATLYL